ncbi:hypothetical protein ACIA71_02035 [Streptomyces anulatus]
MSAFQAAFEALRKTVGDVEADKLLTAVESESRTEVLAEAVALIQANPHPGEDPVTFYASLLEAAKSAGAPKTENATVLCRCGHGAAYHDAKYSDPQCRLCPEDGERMWRHPFTPAEVTS